MPRRRVQFRKGESLFHAIVIPTDCDPGLGPANAICPGRNYRVKGTAPRSYGYRLGLPSSSDSAAERASVSLHDEAPS